LIAAAFGAAALARECGGQLRSELVDREACVRSSRVFAAVTRLFDELLERRSRRVRAAMYRLVRAAYDDLTSGCESRRHQRAHIGQSTNRAELRIGLRFHASKFAAFETSGQLFTEINADRSWPSNRAARVFPSCAASSSAPGRSVKYAAAASHPSSSTRAPCRSAASPPRGGSLG
jgi:hypothetical protein